MPDITPSVDPTLPAPLPVLYGAEPSEAPLPVDPEPGPGNPSVPFVPPLFSEGLRIQVLLTDAVTHEPVDEIKSAVVDDFDEDVDLLVPCSASVHTSLWDDVWDQVATATTTDDDGRPVHRWSPKVHGISIGVNGRAKWTGLFRQPIDHGPDEMLLPARSPSILFFEDILGEVQQKDSYEGWGDFESFPLGSTPPDMRLEDGVTAVVVASAAHGTKGLLVTGPKKSWAHCKRIGLPGDANNGRTAQGSTFASWPDTFAPGTPTIITWTQRADSLIPSNRETSLREAGSRPDGDRGFSDDPVTSGCIMSKSTITHHTWAALAAHPDGVVYDVVRLAQGILTGFTTPVDGSLYPGRILRDAKSEILGGFPYGIDSVVRSVVGHDEFAETWGHAQTHTVSDVLSAAMDRDGGAEAYINADNTMVVHGQLGRFRDDLLLCNANTTEATWAIDPGDEIDEFVGLTGRGSGTSLLACTVSQPKNPLQPRHRITKIARIPNGLSLNSGDAWTQRHARVSARQAATGTCTVSWEEGDEIFRGDIVPAAFSAGEHGWWDPVRILNKRYVREDHACVLTWGATDG